jgi:hypothetical protein
VESGGFGIRGGISIVDVRARTLRSSIGRVNRSATWPFAKLRLNREQITISSPFGPFLITRTNLVSIAQFDGLTSDGIRFEVTDRYDAAIFWTYRMERVLDELRSHGWAVDEHDRGG